MPAKSHRADRPDSTLRSEAVRICWANTARLIDCCRLTAPANWAASSGSVRRPLFKIEHDHRVFVAQFELLAFVLHFAAAEMACTRRRSPCRRPLRPTRGESARDTCRQSPAGRRTLRSNTSFELSSFDGNTHRPRLTPPPVGARFGRPSKSCPLGSSTDTSTSASPVQETATTQSRTTASCNCFRYASRSASWPSLSSRSSVALATRDAVSFDRRHVRSARPG